MRRPTILRAVLGASLAISTFAAGLAGAGLPDHPLRNTAAAAETGRYIVVLRDAANADSVVARARTLDASAAVTHRSTVLPGHVWMSLSRAAAGALRNDARVARVVTDAGYETERFAIHEAGNAAFNVRQFGIRAANAPPLSSNPEAGKGVRVAIISTGVDYTHTALGGDGTPESYAEALANASAIWPGFPTDVVVGGLDAKSDFGSIDPNPIEHSVADVDMSRYPSVPAGRGTRLAGIVHALAPGADLLAYKVWSITPTEDGELQASYVDSADMDRVMTHILDPNADGDDNDRADIVLIDSLGGLAFYTPFEENDSPDSVRVDFIQALAARGVLVVTDTGDIAPESRYGMSWDGAAPDALTVGAMESIDATTFAATAFSARGPVRGTVAPIKPDLVAHGVDIDVAIPGSGDAMEPESSSWAAAARVAAAAAVLKAERPALSALQIKALLANTARHDLRDSTRADANTADVPVIGMGRPDLDAAIGAGALIHAEGSYQPSINFGFHELDRVEEFQRQLVIHNLGDTDRVFTLAHEMTGEKAGHAALALEYPASVNVPAGHQVTIPLAITVDPARLPAWPLTATPDYTNDAWRAVQLGGYLVATSQSGNALSVGWLITPRAGAMMRKHVETLEEIFDSPLKTGFSPSVYGLRQDFTNTGVAHTSYLALPLMAERAHPPADLARSYGHYLQHVAGGVFDEPACTTGRKLVLGVTLHKPAEVAAANYFDKIGDVIVYFEIFRESAVQRYGYDVSVGPGNLGQMTDADYINYGFVALDETGRPITVTTNLDIPYDVTDPDGRYQVSTLPTLMSTNTRNIVAQMCTEDLFHHTFRDESELDRNLGFTVATDRDVMPTIDTPIIQFNPVKYGYILDTGFAVVNLGAKVSLNRKADDGTFSNTLTLARGETGTLTGIKDATCDSFGLVQVDCNRSFLLMGLNTNFLLDGEVMPGGASTIATVKSNQVFSVSEDALAGDVIGVLELDADGFFAYGPDAENPNRNFAVYQVNALPGDPFRIEHDGTLLVNNPAALDHESQPLFHVLARTGEGNDQSSSREVLVRVTNVNDSPPVYTGGLDAVAATAGVPFELSLEDYFDDPDGDALSYTVNTLPGGMVLDAGRITGTVTASGNHGATVTVTDGLHEITADMMLKIAGDTAPAPALNSGGGAFGLPLLFAMLAAALSRCLPETRRKCVTLFFLAGAMMAGAAHAGDPGMLPHQGVGSKALSVERGGKPLYFVHLENEPLAIHARDHFSGTAAFSGNRLQVDSRINRQYTQQLQVQQDAVAARIHAAAASDVAVVDRYTLALNALLIAADESDIAAIRALPGVVHIEKVAREELHTDRGPAHIGAIQTWNGVGEMPGTQGEGVTIGIIDTGIRTDHPSFADIGGDGYDHANPLGAGNYLGDCVDNARLCNDKLIGVISYPEITDSYEGVRPADGYDYNGHGTHVASTAAGNILDADDLPENGEFRFPRISGVAPHANIISYQVCFPATGGCLPPLAVSAVEHAIANGVDVINYSIGSQALNPWEATSALAMMSARAAGIHVAVSAGNAGPDPSTVTTPANAPWVTGVAAYTHDRDYNDPALTNFTGGDTSPRGPYVGKGLTNGYQGPIVSAADFGDALCLQPFPVGTFDGEIVVCARGTNPRVEKGQNVKAGGAGGMVLFNTRDTDDDLFADPHALPGIHVNAATGATLLAWLSTGTQHAAEIKATEVVSNPALADIAANFSSRGPVLPFQNMPGPNVAAPGVDIYAAWISDAAFSPGAVTGDFAFLNGTSMASPHVAGSLALLTALHPDWSPAEAQSALVTTAKRDTRSNDRDASTTFDHGGGRIDVPAAASAGLVLDETEDAYLAANPATGGDPTHLNLPILIQESCMLECQWQRTVKATSAGTWNVTTESPAGTSIAVEPATFTLGAGETQALTITATVDVSDAAEWMHGSVTLTPRHAASATVLPVAVRFQSGRAPEFVIVSADADSGSAPVDGYRSIGSDSLHIEARGLVKAGLHEAFLSQDPTPGKRFDVIDNVVHVVPLNIHSRTRVMIVEILEADAPDLDLYIGRDMNLDGKPNQAEWNFGGLCLSGLAHSLERCVLESPEPGVYWIAVQNFAASAPDAKDRHLLSVATIEDGNNGLAVTGPANISNGEDYALQAAWDIDMQAGDRYYAQISVGSSPVTPGNIGSSILRIDRAADPVTVRVDKTVIEKSESVTYTWEVPGVPANGVATAYLLETRVPGGVTATTDAGAEPAGDTLRWTFTQIPGALPATGHVTLETESGSTLHEIALAFTLTVAGEPAATVEAPTVAVRETPVARINGAVAATISAEPGQVVNIDATASTPSQEDEPLDYEWTQISGPPAVPEAAGAAGMFKLQVPEDSVGETLQYKLVVTSDGIASLPATLKVEIKDTAGIKPPAGGGGNSGGGGTAGLGLLLLAGFARWQRRT